MNLGTNSKYEKIVTEMLSRFGLPRHLLGYEYLKYAILVCIEDYRQIHNLTKGLYPAIALKYNSTGSRVERSIRHAIEISWKRTDIDTVNEIFGYTISKNKRKPTNSEFIATISDAIRIKNKNE